MTEVVQAPDRADERELKRISHWIGGRIVPGESGRSGPVYNPALGVQTAEVDFASAEEVGRAVAAAKEAFPAWRATSLSQRQDILFRIREFVHDRREEIAKFLTDEHGKVFSDALGEVQRGLEVVEHVCGIPTLLRGSFSEQASTGFDVYSIRQPLGVAAGITPFNFPAMVPMWMWAPALACGNTFVLKPSEKDPSASVYVAELLREAGVPDGVFNVVHGDKVAVDAILEHPDVDAISFVGSTPIARYIYTIASANGKRVQALGGAKNHMIVLPDADIEMAADAAVSAGYGSAGERCMAVSAVVAVGDAADPLVEAIKERLPKVKVGPLRARALCRAREDLRRSRAHGQREPVRQRRRNLHARRRRRAPVPVRGPGGDDRDQRPDPGAGRLLLVRRLEVVPLRRLAHLRPRGDQLLHARQGRHLTVAGPGHEQGRPRLPADSLATAPDKEHRLALDDGRVVIAATGLTK